MNLVESAIYKINKKMKKISSTFREIIRQALY
jgi:hypothetical protein